MRVDARTRILFTTAAVLCVLTPLFTAVRVATALSATASLLFLCLAPGCAAAVLVRLRAPSSEIGIVIAVSLAVITLAAEVMLSLHLWNPTAATDILAALCLVVLLVALRPESNATGAPTGAVLPARDTSHRVSWATVRRMLGPSWHRYALGFVAIVALAVTNLTAALCTVVLLIALRPEWNANGAPTRAVLWARDTLHQVNWATVQRLLSPSARRYELGFVAVLALWLVALRQTRVGGLSGYGLISGLPFTYYLALAVLVVGFCFAVMAGRPRAGIVAAYVVLLILILHGTTAVLYPEPRYTWVYKHFGVIDYIVKHGSVSRDVDVYQNWPGFFALNAWFTQVSGWQPINYAAWAQVFFEGLNVSALVFALRGLTGDWRHIWVAIWIFLWANWIGQDYLAPQAFSFFEGLVVIGLVLRCSQRQWVARTGTGRRLSSVLARLQSGSNPSEAEGRVPLAIDRRVALGLGGACFLAVIISHQLSPVILCAAVVALAVTRWCRPIWIPLAMGAATLGWIGLAWPFVSSHFQILSFDIPRAQTPPVLSSSPLGGVGFVRLSELVITGFVAALALGEAVIQFRNRVLPIAVVALAAAPFVVAVAQTYGGESTLRGYLFALPWLAFLAAAGVASAARGLSVRMKGWAQPATLVAVTTGLAVPFLFSYFGQESQNFVTQDDVAVNQWYLAHAPAGAVIGFIGPNSPARLGARYAEMSVGAPGSIVSDDLALIGHPFPASGVARIERSLNALHATARYLVISPSDTNYLLLYGLVPAGWTDELKTALQDSPDFRLVYQSGPAVVFQLITTPARAAPPPPVQVQIANTSATRG
jgi:flavin-binding protein dodecin